MKVKIVLKNTNFSSDEINLTLFPDKAPVTCENFIKLVKEDYYKGCIFHRVIENFMIQTGGYYIEKKNIKSKPMLKPIVGEFSANDFTKNDIKHELGVISMARTNDMNSATSQFFLCAAPCPHLDGQYAAFGIADKKGMKVIEEISKVQTGFLSYSLADFPLEDIVIKEIIVTEE